MLRASLLAAAAAMPMAGMANATPITFTGSYNIAANSGPNGLPIGTQAEYGTPPGQFNNGVFGLQSGQGDGLYVLATFTDVSNPTAVPEPMSLALLGLGLCRPRRRPA